jgi:replicative DNA helicase
MWNLALDAAERGQRILFVSLEMAVQDLALQAVARYSRIPLERLSAAYHPDQGPPLNESESAAVDKAAEKMKHLEMFLRLHGAAQHGRSMDSIIESAVRARFDGVFIDHLGMLARSGVNGLNDLATSVDKLQMFCKGNLVPGFRPFVCAASPLNRTSEKAQDEREPEMSDLWGSSFIESDANLVMILAKQKQKDEDSNAPDLVDGYVVKNRDGRHPLILQFEANGAIGYVCERRRPLDPQPREE